MKTLKAFLVKILLLGAIMLIPAFAGQCELQDNCPAYTIKDGYTLTDEEQRVITATIDYFMNNPDVKTVILNSSDYPSLSISWYNNLILNKIDYLTNYYPYTNENRTITNLSYYTWATEESYNGSEVIVKVNNAHINDMIPIKNFVDHSYAILPQLGIHDGMDELQAVEIINRYICDYMHKDTTNGGNYINAYANPSGVCMDYSELFRSLASGAGIEVHTLENPMHMWNEVIIDGITYEIDVFWNDVYRDYHYTYMLTRSQMARFPYHTIELRL